VGVNRAYYGYTSSSCLRKICEGMERVNNPAQFVELAGGGAVPSSQQRRIDGRGCSALTGKALSWLIQLDEESSGLGFPSLDTAATGRATSGLIGHIVSAAFVLMQV